MKKHKRKILTCQQFIRVIKILNSSNEDLLLAVKKSANINTRRLIELFKAEKNRDKNSNTGGYDRFSRREN
jgi:hypothetical protein